MHLKLSLKRLVELPYELLPWRFDAQAFLRHHSDVEPFINKDHAQEAYALALLNEILPSKSTKKRAIKNIKTFLDHACMMDLLQLPSSDWHREQFARVVSHSLGYPFEDEESEQSLQLWSLFNPLENTRLQLEKERLLKRQQAVKAALERAQQLEMGD